MADGDTVVMGKLNYWCREQHWHHMYSTAIEAQAKYANDPILKFFCAYSYVCEGRVQEGIRELDLLKDKYDVNLAATLALILAHKKSRNVDKEAVQILDVKLKEERKQGGEKALYFAGLVLFHNTKYDKAREYVDRMLKLNPQSKQGLALKGWVELLCGTELNAKKSLKFFEDALNQPGSPEIDALFGKAHFHKMRRNVEGAIEQMNKAVVAYPTLLPALIEKVKLFLAHHNWDECLEQADRALALDTGCVQALVHLTLYELCREGAYSEAAMKIADLLQTMDRVEPKTAVLYHDLAKIFSRVCGRNRDVLVQTYYMQERAVSLDNTDARFVTELGQELLFQGRVKDAIKCYRNAMKLDESSVEALTGVIWCQLLEGQLDEANQQLEFLNEIQPTIGRSPEISYLSSLLCIKRQQSPDKAMKFLDEAIKGHFERITNTPMGAEYFYLLNPDFMLLLVKEYLSFAPAEPTEKGQAPSPVLVRCQRVLDPLVKTVPGLLEGLYLSAKVKYLCGDLEGAQVSLRMCIEKEQSYSEAHILLAEIHLSAGNYKLANSSLELGLSFNFEVREQPHYHLIKARILRKQGQMEESVQELQAAMQLPGVKAKASSLTTGKTVPKISINDRVSVYMELADGLRQLGQEHEAAKVMTDALNEFAGTSQELRIKINNADLAVSHGSIDTAIDTLRQIAPDDPYFVQAREKMAHIYLTQRKDKKLYAACYREILERHPTIQSYLLLGDAYMHIQEPDKAISIYEKALKQNPRDGSLASKIGQALVKTHNYGKAINYYEAAIRSGGAAILRHDLSDLLIKLRQYEKAEKVLNSALEKEGDGTELENLADKAKNLQLLSRVYHRQGKLEECVTTLKKAQEIQGRVLNRSQLDEPDAFSDHKKTMTEMCKEMAGLYTQVRAQDQAIKCYKEALQHADGDIEIMLALARLYLQREDLEGCERQCMALLRTSEGPETDEATVMLGDVKFRRNETEGATYHFDQLLGRRPDHYTALAQLINLLRRAGCLDKVPKYLQLAETANPRVHTESGYNYCQGLYQWYNGNPNEALKYFNKARKDSQWGYKSTCNMVEICLNPDNNTVGGEVFEAVEAPESKSEEMINSEQMALKTAERLLSELRGHVSDLKPVLLSSMLLIATNRNDNATRALSTFNDILNSELTKDNVAALYGQATAYMVLKQQSKAKTALKKLATCTWNSEDAEDLEKSWLLLADQFIQADRIEASVDLLKKCLQYNKSCCKAYEYLGFIQEREQSYKEAAANYELAWKYGNKSNPGIGYKLAFNFLKTKRYVDAIDISQHILSQHPNYPKIRKEILDKARQSIRV